MEILTQIVLLAAVYLLAVAVTPAAERLVGQHPAPREMPHLDGLRGIAAVGVVACHVNQYAMHYLGFPAGAAQLGDHLGIFSVQMFFALTAFLFAGRMLQGRLDLAAFYAGRVRRILPLYAVVVVSALAFAAWWTSGLSYPRADAAREAIAVALYGFWPATDLQFRTLNMLALVGIAWTLAYEWAFYIALGPLALAQRRFGLPALAIAAAITLACAAYAFSTNADSVIWPFFLPGIATAMLLPLIPVSAALRRALALGLVIAACLALALPGYWTMTKLTLAWATFFALAAVRPAALLWRPLQTLGRISFSIYLLQYLVLFPVANLLVPSGIVGGSPVLQIAAMGLVVVLLVPLAAISYRWVEMPGVLIGSRTNRTRRTADHSHPGRYYREA